MNTKHKPLISLLLLFLTLGVNYAGANGLINGMSQKDVSDKSLTLITPAPFTFSIWGLIYLLVFISIVLMIIKASDQGYQKMIDRISPLFWLSFILSMVWIVTFSYEMMGLSAVIIFCFLIILTLICKKIAEITPTKTFFLISFGIYTGWLVIATVVNISAFLVKIKWDGLGIEPAIWAIIILIAALFIVTFISLQVKNSYLPLPVAWAYFGIYRFHNSASGFSGAYPNVSTTALVGMIILLALSLYLTFGKKNFASFEKITLSP